MLSSIFSINPLDGRYASKMARLQDCFSEAALMRYRLRVEIEWLIFQVNQLKINQLPEFNTSVIEQLRALESVFGESEMTAIKDWERRTNHDVKALEYFLREKIALIAGERYLEHIHLFCTSEDINNLAYSLMLRAGLRDILFPALEKIYGQMYDLGVELADVVMIGRTHGQPATPTTVGKEIINFVARLKPMIAELKTWRFGGKFNGAVGNFNAHLFVYPDLDWISISREFVSHLGLTPNLFTTQIEPHDHWAEFFLLISRLNTVFLDITRDFWSYIAIDYFKQRAIEGEVGSSTMPHKVNPIDFENAEGNLGLANALAVHLAAKLPVSRWQRDLSDSTVERNMGLVFGYSLLALQSLSRGVSKLALNRSAIQDDCDKNYQILAEAIQSLLRVQGVPDAYDQLKKMTRGQIITKATYDNWLEALVVPLEIKEQLKKLTLESYCGLAKKLVRSFNPALDTDATIYPAGR